MRILIAAGDDPLEKAFLGSSEHEVRIARDMEGVLNVATVSKPEVVVFSPFLPSQRTHPMDVIRDLRLKIGARVILLVGHLLQTAQGRQFLAQAARLGVYDLIDNPAEPRKVAYHLEHPATAADVAEFLSDSEPPAEIPDPEPEPETQPRSAVTEVVPEVLKKTVDTVGELLSTAKNGIAKPSTDGNVQKGERTGLETAPRVLDHVIAVGGPHGCGASFVAWNLAVALDAVLMEGRTTDSLAAWLGVDAGGTREAYLRGELRTKAAVTTSRTLSPGDLHLLAQVREQVVVDVGDMLDSEVWWQAGKRVFVVSPDPKCRGVEIPEKCIRVMNRYPEAFPIRPEKLVQAQIDIVIPDLGREAFLSLWGRSAWVTKHPEVQEQWRQLFEPKEKAEKPSEVVASQWRSWL